MMNFWLYIIMMITPLLSSCSLIQSYQVKTVASDFIQQDIQKVLESEQKSLIAGKNTRGKDFAKYIQNHTSVEFENVQELNPGTVLLNVKIRTVNPAVRQMVLEMLAKLDQRTSNAYNFSEALGLIQKEKPDLAIEIVQSKSITLHNQDGKWLR